MLEEIRIGSLGVIESSTLELGPGLTVITGETGAGKTMLVTALGLLLGGRADTGTVRTGAKAARVEGVWQVGDLPAFAATIEEAGGAVEDDRVVLARNVSAEGRSRAFAGGASVPVSVLAGLAEPLVAVHGQSDQHRLLAPRAQRDALDSFAGERVATPLARYVDAPRPPARGRGRADRRHPDGSRAGPRGRPAPLRAGRDRGRRTPPGRGRRAGGRGGEARVRRHAARRRRAGPRGALERPGQSRRPGRHGRGTHRAGVGARARHGGRRARRPVGRAHLPPVRPGRRRGVVRVGARDRPLAPRARVGAAGVAHRPHPQVRRHHRRGARLGGAVVGAAPRPRRHRRPDRAAARGGRHACAPTSRPQPPS